LSFTLHLRPRPCGMKYYSLLFFALFTLLTACNDGVDRVPIVLDGSAPERPARFVQTTDSQMEEIANGVMIRRPDDFREARSFDGYQHIYGAATISLEIRNHGLERIERMYTDRALSARDEELLEYHPVDYFGNDKAFLTVTKALRKGVYKFLLSVEREERTYNVKALCSFQLGDNLNMYTTLKDALLTTKIEDYQTGPTDFLAVEGALGGEVFTRDGQYPTLSADRALIKSGLTVLADGEDHNTLQRRMIEELGEITGEDNARFRTMPLTNGMILQATASSDSLYAFIAVVYSPDQPVAKKFTGTATTSEAIDNIRTFVLESSTRRQLGIR